MLIKQRQLPDKLPFLPTYPPFLQRIYATRGIQNESELNRSLQALHPYQWLKDIDKACARLEQALRLQERILIIGDFDADGATSTALGLSALRAMGALHVDFLVPNRFDFGYGLTPAIVEVAKTAKPHLIITVDNGIASLDGVHTANAAGIDVLVTDHHLPAEILPAACAIVNPNQPGDDFPSKAIAGVGVIFYVMLALRRRLSESHWFSELGIAEPNMAQFLDLVALGTVADVVPLDRNNRIMIKQGLLRIRQGQCSVGIQALLEMAGRDYTRVRETDLSFVVAPRLNAAGRLDDMSLGIECLLSQELSHARKLAQELDALNQERRAIEINMKQQALALIEQLIQDVASIHHLPMGLCLMDPSWHQGVIGILAGRLKERYHRPVIIFARVSESEIKGSARSIPGLNIRDVLAAIDRDYPGLMTKFGGHAMAAGLSLDYAGFNTFQTAFVAEVTKHLGHQPCEGVVWTDGSLKAQDLSLETALALHRAGPWGQQFPEPSFDDVFDVLEQRIVGGQHLKLTLAHPKGGVLDAIAFNVDLTQWPNPDAKQVHVAYKLDINVYQGKTKLQLLIECLSLYNSVPEEPLILLETHY